jgi:tetratricopeptide (TPR) repeat protein
MMKNLHLFLTAIFILGVILAGCSNDLKHIEDRPVFLPPTGFTDYYWSDGEQVGLNKNADKRYILLSASEIHLLDSARLAYDFIREPDWAGVIPDSTSMDFGTDPDSDWGFADIDSTFFHSQGAGADAVVWAFVESSSPVLKGGNFNIRYEAPFFITKQDAEKALSHLFRVKLKREQDFNTLRQLADKYRVSLLYRSSSNPLWYTLECRKESHGNALEMANLFFESGLFAEAVPSFLDVETMYPVVMPPADLTDEYYLFGERRIPVQRVDNKFYVLFRDLDEQQVEHKLTEAGITIIALRSKYHSHLITAFTEDDSDERDITDKKVAVTIEGNYEQAAHILSTALYWAPYYRTEDGHEMGLTELFTVVFKPNTTLAQLEKLAKENSVELIGRDRYEHTLNWYRLVCTRLSKGNALEMANLFFDSGLFETAFPSFIGGWQYD